MKSIGGNITAAIQKRTTQQDSIGARVPVWETVQEIRGWLDLASGQSKYIPFGGKVQESTHLFIGDFVPIDESVTAENSRLVIRGKTYDIMLIDNPMEMGYGSQLEIYLKYTGGQ